MRIDCEQCSAAFTIDDALISDRGVRAQCPKCGHQKVVKKPPSAAPSPPATPFGAPSPSSSSPFGPPAANPFGAPPSPSPSPLGGAAAPNPFAPPSPSANPFAPPSPSANPFAPPSPSANPFGAPTGSANPFGAPTGSANPFAPSAGPLGGGAFDAPGGNPFAPSTPPDRSAFALPTPPRSPAIGASPFGAAKEPTPDPFAGGAANPFGAGARDPFAGISVDEKSERSEPFAPRGGKADPFGGADPFATRTDGGLPRPDPFGAGGASGAAARPDPFAAGAGFAGKPPAADPWSGAGLGARDVSAPSGLETAAPSDPFGQVVDVVDDKAKKVQASGKWVLRNGPTDETLELGELRERVKLGAVGADDVVGPVGGALKPVKDTPLLAVSLAAKKGDEKSRVKGARARRLTPEIPKPLALVAAVVVALGALGGGAWVMKPELFERRSEAGVNPLRRARPAWQRQFPDVEGTAQEHLVEGRRQMRLDTAAGYRKADDEFRQSLLLDIGNVPAIAAWAENYANLPTVRADLEGSTLAQEALEYGLKREPENVELLRAQGAIKLALGNIDETQRVLARALKLSPGDLDSLVLLARSNLDRNSSEALATIQREVRAKDTENKLAYTIEGAAQRRLGAYREARELLEARLVTDPHNVGALKELAKLELDLGHTDAALTALGRLLDAEDKDVEAHLLRAKISYQIKGGPEGLKAADAQLGEVLGKHEGAAGEQLLAVLAHAAFVKTQLGKVDEAIALGERARASDPAHPAALHALGRAYAQKGDNENARKTLEQAVRAAETRDSFYEPMMRATLALVQARSGDIANAIRNDERVIEFDPRNLRAHFGLAALYVKENKFTQAMTIMKRALANDPAWERDRLVPTDYPTTTSDLLEWADTFRDAKAPPGDDSLVSLKYSSEGIIRYHAGQKDRAETLFHQAIKYDTYNHAALLYLSILDMERGRFAEPKAKLKEAIATTAASHAVTQLYLGRVQAALGDLEGARKRLSDLAETEPTLVQARYSLAMVLRAQKLEAQATTELKAVVQQDPDFLPAKQALAEKL